MADTNDILAAIQIATTQAQAQYQAAVVAAKGSVDAHLGAAQIEADAQIKIAHIVAGWQNTHSTAELEGTRVSTIGHVDATRLQAGAEVDAASIRADAEKYTADRRREADEAVANAHAKGQVDAAKIEGDATRTTAENHRSGLVESARIAADADRTVAVTHAGAETGKATIDGQFAVQAETIRAEAATDVATITTANQTEVARIEATARTQTAQVEGQYRVLVAQAEGTWHVEVATIESTASNYRADKELAGVNAHEAGENNRLGVKLAFAQSIYDQIKPIIQQIVDAGTDILGGSGGSGGFNPTGLYAPTPQPSAPMGFRMSAAPGDVTRTADVMGFHSHRHLDPGPPVVAMGDLDPPVDAGQGVGGSTAAAVTVTVPYIASRGVFTPTQLQQQVNAAYARNDARTQTQIRQAQGDLAGRGFSSTSPILDALRVGFVTANLRASIEAATQIRLQSAQANVDAVFRAQQAKSEQYLKQEDVLINAAQVAVQRQVGILNAVASLVGGVL